MDSDLHVVTGAFRFTGKYLARRLLDQGERAEEVGREYQSETKRHYR